MQYYDFTLRFDNDEHSLTAKNGLPIDQLAEVLSSLFKAVNLAKDEHLVLSEIRGNCYALNLSTNSVTAHEKLKVIHKKISDNDYIGLNNDQRKYANKLKLILSSGLSLQAYDHDKKFKVDVIEVELPKSPDFYFEICSVYGIVTSIGGATLDGKATVHINRSSFEIEVNEKQERELIKYYKKGKLRFVINKRIDVQTNIVKDAIMIDYEIIISDKLSSYGQKLREKLGETLYKSLEDDFLKQD